MVYMDFKRIGLKVTIWRMIKMNKIIYCKVCNNKMDFRRKKWNDNIWTNYYCESCGNHQ